MKKIIKSPWTWLVVIIIAYNSWVKFFTPKGLARSAIAKVDKQFQTYHEEHGEWPSDLSFIANKEILQCCGSPIVFNADDPSFRFEFTQRTPMEKLLELIILGPVTSWSVGKNYSNKQKSQNQRVDLTVKTPVD